MSDSDYKIDPAYLSIKLAGFQAQVGPDVPLLPLFIEQTRKVLATGGAAYKRYGPYWWAVKRILRAGGLAVGTYDEPSWAGEYEINGDDGTVDAETTLLAAWEFADDNTGEFGVLTDEYDLAGVTFVLYDPDQAGRGK
jgi:hypothetical protein